jgi:hypothetical protein
MPVEMRLLYFEPMTMGVDRVKCFKFRNDIQIFHEAIVLLTLLQENTVTMGHYFGCAYRGDYSFEDE